MKNKKCLAKDNKQFFDMFNDLRLEVILRVVDIGGIVELRCLRILSMESFNISYFN